MIINKKLLKNIDYSILIVVAILFCIGIVMIISATNANILGLNRQVKFQAIGFAIGIVAMFLVMWFDYNTFGDFYKIIYILSIGLLLLVYIKGLGVVHNNARSWINLGSIDFQTSELAKIGFIISYAKFLESKYYKLNSIKNLFLSVLFVAPFIILLLKQPDFGSALVFVVIAVVMLFYAGIEYKIIGIVALITLAVIPFLSKILKPYQLNRIEAFLHPNDPSLPGNYHVMQSKITIGSGQTFGKGLFQGEYHRYDYLPVQETDFIFAVTGEELGFAGGTSIILLYFYLLMRILRVSRKSKDVFGSLIAIGVFAMFLFQIFENIGMTIGLMPVTGVTLPFLSYGGSSIITSMIAIGLVLNVYMRRKRKSHMI